MVGTACMALGCAADSASNQLQVPIVVDGSGTHACTNNLGYTVTLSTARVAIEDVELTVEGEPHTAWHRRVSKFFVSTAYAHPGHEQGGAVLGELPGRWLFDFTRDDGAVLGLAELQAAQYSAGNFDFARADVFDGLSGDDALVGHTALLAGTATRGGHVIDFAASIDSPLDRQLVGAPFVAQVSAEQPPRAIGLRMSALDPLQGDCLFDDVDFAALRGVNGAVTMVDDAGDVAASEAYNTLRRTFQTHDHFDFTLRE